MDTPISKSDAVVLKPERDKHVRNRHPWVFMGAIASYPENFQNGDIVPVLNSGNNFIGYGYFHKGQSISGRMISFSAEKEPLEIISKNITAAVNLRKQIIPATTNAYRLINGEGDNLPGLIVDFYNGVLVLQINTLGIERLKPLIIETLQKLVAATAIYEKSATATRRKEGLPDAAGWLLGEKLEPIIITEHGLQFSVDFQHSQKTGFFLDQREMRQLVKTYAKDKSVLNCFSYTGGFSIYALSGGAQHVDSIDISYDAITTAKINSILNNFSEAQHGFHVGDVLPFLQQTKNSYDFIILDPPAFAKRASDVENASRGYRDINRAAMHKLPAGGLLLTSSCSAHIDRELFQTIIFQAAKDVKRNVKILSYHVLASDHPVSLFYPEGDYLKSLLLYIE